MNQEFYDTNRNEPKMHPLIEKSFVFLHTAGSRPSPEVLILELFREIFFEQHYNESSKSKTKLLDPEETEENSKRKIYNERERAVIYALKGRHKKVNSQKLEFFYAPAYFTLTKNCGLRKQSDRVVKNFLLSGPIVQYLWNKSSEKWEEFVESVLNALIGNKTYDGEEVKEKEILSATLRDPDLIKNSEIAKDNILKKINENIDLVIKGIENDEISNRIYNDFLYICKLEAKIPRIQWILVLMTFLRFALPMWMLSHMQITSFLHEWLLDAVDNGKIANNKEIRSKIERRNREILKLTLTPSRQVFEHIERYIKHRVEINILLAALGKLDTGIEKKRLVLDESGNELISIDESLLMIMGKSKQLKDNYFNGIEAWRFLAREGEKSTAWRNPIKNGQGKNIDEFVRVMYQDKIGDEAGGYLLTQKGRGINRGFIVFPGQLLLSTITYLSAVEKQEIEGKGKLMLIDIEKHFEQYGIDFSSSVNARPRLIQQLDAMGLLKGSPDAGSSVAVNSPY